MLWARSAHNIFICLQSMGRKRDIQQIEAIAREFKMYKRLREDFGDFIEQEKADGHRGSLNDKGDFTYAELRQKAKEFLGEIKP